MSAEHIPEAVVTFGLRNILLVNNRSFESADLVPNNIEEIVECVDDDLQRQFTLLEQQDRIWREQQSSHLRPTILIARLALYDQPYMALTRKALISGHNFFTHGSVLTEEALPYWNSASATSYQPEVHHLRGTNSTTSGVWLGISPKD